jgi:hypothetical protein
MWIAEGFIPLARKHEVEETARQYVSKLAQRSLMQVTPLALRMARLRKYESMMFY